MAHALVVDDSRTARAVLKHMLSKEDYAVTALESAEEALQFLREQATDIIFMDHMMPGMDGFAAVKHLKQDEATRSIPVVMYTSKEGEIYTGQAHALGAAAILNKPATQEQLRELLAQVIVRRPVDKAPDIQAANETLEVVVLDPPEENKQSAPDRRPQRAAQSAATPTPDKSQIVLSTEPAKPARISTLFTLFALAFAGAAVVFAFLYRQQLDELENFQQVQDKLLESTIWATNQAALYPSHELPLAGARLELLDAVLQSVQLTGFTGKVLLRTHSGQFCYAQAADGSLYAAADAMPITDCVVIGQNEQVSLQRGRLQTPQFTALLSGHAALQSGAVTVQVEAVGSAEPAVEYPHEDAVITAGDWNRVARLNNRVEIALQPARD